MYGFVRETVFTWPLRGTRPCRWNRICQKPGWIIAGGAAGEGSSGEFYQYGPIIRATRTGADRRLADC